MGKAPNPLFLERRSYRQRRLMDAARLLPLLGAFLWALPLLWQTGEDGARTSSAMLFIFGVWIFLALSALVLSLRMEREPDEAEGDTRSETGTR